MSLSKSIKQKAEFFQAEKEDFGQDILDEMERIAISMNLDKMMLLYYGNYYERNGKEVESKRLDALDQLYCDMIHTGGFQGIWTKGKGKGWEG